MNLRHDEAARLEAGAMSRGLAAMPLSAVLKSPPFLHFQFSRFQRL